ncbi:hypothetical protein [Mycobacterium sp.]|uniref:hypothetical protein n=1 Tax=Mycobacterium sp. TaxID=1785 RepID=UPI0025D4182A|nr:hypothetical protein [Mycobacterium sp.]
MAELVVGMWHAALRTLTNYRLKARYGHAVLKASTTKLEHLIKSVVAEGVEFCQGIGDWGFCQFSAVVSATPGRADACPLRTPQKGGLRECVVVGLLQSCDGADTLEQGRIGPAAGHPVEQRW